MDEEKKKIRLLKEEAWLLADKHDGERSPAFETDRERLWRGEPLAYIIGWVPFLDTRIYLDSYPLIPRSETEYWTSEAIKNIQKHANGQAVRVLDLCAGSGCIGVAVAKAIPNTQVDFAEIEEKHHSTILKNVTINGIDTSRTRIFGGSLFDCVPKTLKDSQVDEIQGTGKLAKEPYRDTYGDEPTGTRNEEVRYLRNFYDFILTNPPYIDSTLDRTEQSVKNFEPHDSLYGGKQGFEIIERIIRELPDRLRRSGICYLEHEPEQEGLIAECAAQNGLAAETLPDQYGVKRYSKLSLLDEVDVA